MATDAARTAITCSQCGGGLDFREGARNTACRFCGTGFAVTGAAGIPRFYLPERLGLPESRAAVRKFAATAGVEERVAARLAFRSGELCYLPFWRLLGYAVGWTRIERETTVAEREVDENGHAYEVTRRGPNEIVSETVAKRVDVSVPACDLAPYGLKGIATVSSVQPLQGVCFASLAARGTVFDPVKPVAEVRSEALAAIRGALRTRDVIRCDSDLALCDERIALVSYPVWNLVFTAGSRQYPVVVDAVNGTILKARFPGKARLRLFAPLAAVTLMIYLLSLHATAGGIASLCILYWLACRENCAARGEFDDGFLGAFRCGPSWAGLGSFLFRLVEPGKEVEHG